MLSPMEKEKYESFTRALTEDQRKVVIANLRTTELQEELDRRYIFASAKIDEIYNIVDSTRTEDIDLVGMQKFLKELKDVLL